MASSGPADLPRIRGQVGRALEDFLDRQRVRLSGIGADMLPCLQAITELLAGGKRLRSAFCYWGWRASGGQDCPQILAAAAALELLHASALVHDDVMDGSDTRRGRPAVHRRFAARHAADGWQGSPEAFGAGAAILIGDLLLAWTDELFHASGLPQAALRRGQGVLDVMRTEVFSGQYLDLAGQAAGSTTVESALRVVIYKAAKYTIERPLHLGMALADGAGHLGAGQAGLSAALTGYGIPLGIAFQLRDDILGVFGDPAVTGKPVSDDVREGKRTVLIAIARERADVAQAAALERHLGDPMLSETAAAEIRKVIADTGALAECELIIDKNIEEALAALAEAPIAAAPRAALGELAVAATARRD
jgi:geranylgeranyl diphosphate synthase type I